MDNILSIGIVVIGVIFAVHFVKVHAYKQGVQAGVDKGRLQVLTENYIRSECTPLAPVDREIYALVDSLMTERKRIEYVPEYPGKCKC